ncbi:hypothetical protein HYH02_014503 [Chlamydomonas schloesseri]|uniref:Uncharacterized protein n=1 Tax=Chlamydomonas schloesseri TaxID=2026947 RepID=A0A835VWN8_9CHLO|nr:hypothetical protein HYH02_014503 [Chlamydomonas schloesseri]|eukprot:KAG2427901.1 hypothetical protein HYH02_014503 [Chlamydomonas schloesseri]
MSSTLTTQSAWYPDQGDKPSGYGSDCPNRREGTTSSAYSTCYKSVSNADCVNACTVGCTISSSNIGGFASKNPTGCCRCLTNSLGWCGCGSTVNYCCAY